MPQMEFADYMPQLVWLAITFTAFYFVMARVALPRIAEAIESRQERVANDLETATRMREEAEEALAAYEATMAKARAEALGAKVAGSVSSARPPSRPSSMPAPWRKRRGSPKRWPRCARACATWPWLRPRPRPPSCSAVRFPRTP